MRSNISSIFCHRRLLRHSCLRLPQNDLNPCPVSSYGLDKRKEKNNSYKRIFVKSRRWVCTISYHIKIQNIAWDDIAAKTQLKKDKPTEIWNLLQEREGCCLQNSVSFVNKTVTPADEHAAARERSAVTCRIPKENYQTYKTATSKMNIKNTA